MLLTAIVKIGLKDMKEFYKMGGSMKRSEIGMRKNWKVEENLAVVLDGSERRKRKNNRIFGRWLWKLSQTELNCTMTYFE